MTIRTIRVTAGRTFNHPHEQYSNLRPEVELIADLQPGDDPDVAAKTLQAHAEGLVEDHKQGLLKSIEELHNLTVRQQEMLGLQQQLQIAQTRLDEIRRIHPELKLIGDSQ